MKVLNWPEAYMKAAIEDEIALTHIHPQYRSRKVVRPRTYGANTLLEFAAPRGSRLTSPGLLRTTFDDRPPHWRRNWGMTGSLIGELGLEVRHDQDEGTVTVSAAGRRRGHTEQYRDHPGVDEAVNAAVVRAAIQIFTEARDAT